jgi:hypothetical protein
LCILIQTAQGITLDTDKKTHSHITLTDFSSLIVRYQVAPQPRFRGVVVEVNTGSVHTFIDRDNFWKVIESIIEKQAGQENTDRILLT